MADKTLNVVSICGSLRKGSYNRMLMSALPGMAPEGMSIKEAPPFTEFPLYNADIQNSTGFPAAVNALADAIRAADGVVIVTPEYNFGIPGALKNAIDWVSRCRTSRSPASRLLCSQYRPDRSAVPACNTICAGRWCSSTRLTLNKPEIFIGDCAQRIDDKTGQIDRRNRPRASSSSSLPRSPSSLPRTAARAEKCLQLHPWGIDRVRQSTQRARRLRQPAQGLLQRGAGAHAAVACAGRTCRLSRRRPGTRCRSTITTFRTPPASRQMLPPGPTRIRAADGVIIVSPEYNWSIPGGLKNAIDWVSRMKDVPFKEKPVALQSCAGGVLGGSRMQYHMRQCLTSIDAFLYGKPEVLVTFAAKKVRRKDAGADRSADHRHRQAAARRLRKFIRRG